jgi:hypothetical protein
MMAYLDSIQARLVSLPLASLRDFVREPHKGVISHKGTMLQSAMGGGCGAVQVSGRAPSVACPFPFTLFRVRASAQGDIFPR